MIRKEKNGTVWLEFESLQSFPRVRHAVLIKKHPDDTHSSAPGDLEAENVRLVMANQVHQDAVKTISTRPIEPVSVLDSCDALATNISKTALAIRHADCQAALFYDPAKNCLAAVHAGWRGSCLNIYQKTIDALQRSFGCAPQDLYVCISPSLGPAAGQFINFERELPEAFWQFQIKPMFFDFWQISRWQLEAAGILPEHIEIAGLCTYSMPEFFFSYRRDKLCGRHITLIWKDQ